MTHRAPLTPRQHVTVVTVVLAAVALLLNRPYLPAALKAEFHGRTVVMTLEALPVARHVPRADLRSMTCDRRVLEFDGDPKTVTWCEYPGSTMLLVTDSLGWQLPLPADRLVIFGGGPGDAAELVPAHVRRRYEAVVIWTGHVPLLAGPSAVDPYLAGLDRLVATVRPVAGVVYVCVPFDHRLSEPLAGKWRDKLAAGGDRNTEAVAQVRRALEARADITVLPLDELKRQGRLPPAAWWRDGFHLSPQGRGFVASHVLAQLHRG